MKSSRSDIDRSERGASLAEFSLVLPILLLITIGLLELGIAFRTSITVSSAASEGARVASFMGDDSDADCVAIEAAIALLGDQVEEVTSFQIYRVDSDGDAVASDTNTYVYDGIGDITDCAEWLAPPTSILWTPTSRQVTVGTLELDVLGFRIQSTHDWVTQFPPFSGSRTVDESTIVRIEPEAFDT